MVLPCDLVCELDGSKLLAAWMSLNTESEADGRAGSKMPGGMGVWYATDDAGEHGVGVKKEECDFVVTTAGETTTTTAKNPLTPHTHPIHLSMSQPTANAYSTSHKLFSTRASALPAHTRLHMHRNYRDAHVYFLPYWTKGYMAANEAFDTIGEDVVGYWAKARWQGGLAGRLGLGDVLDKEAEGDEVDVDVGTGGLSSTVPRLFDRSRDEGDASATTTAQRVPGLTGYFHPRHVPRQPADHNTSTSKPGKPTTPTAPTAEPTPLLRRIDTVPLLLRASLYLSRHPGTPYAHHEPHHPSTPLPPQSRITNTLLDTNTSLSPRITLTDSVIGSNCVIESGVSISGCVVMDGVVVRGRAKVSGCVLGRKCVVDAEAELRECVVQGGYGVGAGTVARGEVLAGFEGEFEEEGGEEGDAGVAFG